MQFLTAIDGALALIHQRGVYRQAPLYLRGSQLYAKYGAGFIRLSTGGATSAPNIRWAEIDTPDGAYVEQSHFLEYRPAPAVIDAKKVAAE